MNRIRSILSNEVTIVEPGRRRSARAACGSLIALLGIFGAFAWLETRQDRLDGGLIEAVSQIDADRVRTLLARGADPDAHVQPRIPAAPSWRALVARLAAMFLPSNTPSVLDIAVQRDMDVQPLPYSVPGSEETPAFPHRMESARAIIESLVRRGADTRSGALRANSGLDAYQRRLAACPDDLPTSPPDSNSDPNSTWNRIYADAVESIRTNGACCRAYTDLAECQLRLREYSASSRSFGLALLWSPFDAAAHAGKDRADALARASRAVTALERGRDDAALAVRPYRSEPDSWAGVTTCGNSGRVRVGLYTIGNGRVRPLTQRLTLPDIQGLGDLPYATLLFVCALSGRARPVLVVDRTFDNGYGGPSRLDVVAWEGGRLVPVLSFTADRHVDMQRLQGNGDYLFRVRTKIDTQETCLWLDIFTFRNGRLWLANRDHPDEFDETMKWLEQSAADKPVDGAVLLRVGMIDEYRQETAKALAAYRKARRACLRA